MRFKIDSFVKAYGRLLPIPIATRKLFGEVLKTIFLFVILLLSVGCDPTVPAPLPPTPSSVWTKLPALNSPTRRYEHTFTWTGMEGIVFGGYGPGGHQGVGAKFSPLTNSWSEISTINSPINRNEHTATWTGSELVIWGGTNGSPLNSGGIYNPSLDSWMPTNLSEAPLSRTLHSATWTGDEIVIFGGYNGFSFYNSGAKFNPTTNTWSSISNLGGPSPRSGHSAVWTGSEVIIWGGHNLNDGAIYNPKTDTWRPMSSLNAPIPRNNGASYPSYSTIWTGTKMIIFGGVDMESNRLATGAAYDPNADTWTEITAAPNARSYHTAVWTGSKMIIWGGYRSNSLLGSNDGLVYKPNSNSWDVISSNSLSPRSMTSAIWTGEHLLIWGGYDGTTASGDGAIYGPSN